MNQLWLHYTDENGERRRVSMPGEKYVIGRHSANDLCIPHEKISREHLEIERRDDRFIAVERGSSNGTTLNGDNLFEPTFLRNGDELNLGGALAIEVEIGAAAGDDAAPADFSRSDASPNAADSSQIAAPALARKTGGAAAEGGIPMSFFYLAPLFGLGVLLLLGAIVYVSSGSDKTERSEKENEFVYSGEADEDTDEPKSNLKPEKTARPTIEKAGDSNSKNSNSGESGFSSGSDDAVPLPNAPKNTSDMAKIEQNSTAFLRRIAQNDPKAFLTSEQAKIIDAKINQLSGSPALADNIKSAKANAAQIQALAAAKNMKPQFLAVAALAKLGANRGSVLQTAQAMTDVLEKLDTHIGNELADETLLVIAAYEQGAARDFLKMRNLLQQLSNQFPESSRTIRSIWFLHKKGKISDAQFDFAVRFLAIGTITQNPKDFNVNAEELKFN